MRSFAVVRSVRAADFCAVSVQRIPLDLRPRSNPPQIFKRFRNTFALAVNQWTNRDDLATNKRIYRRILFGAWNFCPIVTTVTT